MRELMKLLSYLSIHPPMVGALGNDPSSCRLQRHVSTCFTKLPKRKPYPKIRLFICLFVVCFSVLLRYRFLIVRVSESKKTGNRIISSNHCYCNHVFVFLFRTSTWRFWLLCWILSPALILMVGLNGLEPLTHALSTRCSNQLSYNPI